MSGVSLVCRSLEGDFGDWTKFVPTNNPIQLKANRSKFMHTIDRVGLLISEKIKSPVRCRFGENTADFRTITTIGEAHDVCQMSGDGRELEIGFNVRYLADALRAVPGEEVVLELTNSLSPIVMTPVDDKKDFAYMVLPVRINTN